jgi:thioredoxin
MIKNLTKFFLVSFFVINLLKAERVKPEDFNQIINQKRVVVVKFWASWCMPCSILKPEFNKAKKIMSKKVKFVEYNVDLGGKPLTKYNINLIPTMIIFKNGKEVSRDSSILDSQAIVDWISKYTN